MIESTVFWDRIANSYSKKPVPSEKVYERKLEITRQYLTPHSAVVEIGCGTGTTAIKHAPFVSHILAADISKKMIEIARKKSLKNRVINVDFEQSSIDDLEVDSSTKDAVLAMSVLHLIKDRDAVIEKACSWLKPGGVMVTSTTCLRSWFMVFTPIFFLANKLGLLPMVFRITHASLIESFKRAGFQIEEYWEPEKTDTVFIVAKKTES